MKKFYILFFTVLLGTNFGFSQGSWITSPVTSPVSSYRGAAATVNLDGITPQLYVLGGWGTTSGNFNETSIYNFVGDTWETGPTIPENAKGGSAACIGDNIYLLCGNDGGDVNINSKTFIKYNITSGDWEYLAEYPVAARYVSMAYNANNGLIYCAGGSGDYYMAVDNVNAYDPETDTWITCTTLPFPSSGGSAMVYVGNHLYLVGGLINEPYNKLFKGFVDVNDPSNITWTYGTPMPLEMTKLSAGYIGNGKIVATELDGTVEYDIAADLWANVTSKPTPVKGGNYGYFEAGNVFTFGIAGGRDANNNYVDHAEYITGDESLLFPVTFITELPNGEPVENAEIQVSSNTIYTDEAGSAVLFLENGTYDYTAQYEGAMSGGTFTVDEGSVFIEVMLPVSIDEITVGFNMYPNPSSGIVNIVLDDILANNDLHTVSVVDLPGRQIYQSALRGSGKHLLDCSDFDKGVYFIILTGANNYKIMRKLVIN